jgi:hypothetical protein
MYGVEGRLRRYDRLVNGARKRRGDDRRLSAEGKLRRADIGGRSAFARRRGLSNPTVGSAVQHPRRGLEEEAVEVVENHADGTRSGGGRPFPKGATTWHPGVDSRQVILDGRAIFG